MPLTNHWRNKAVDLMTHYFGVAGVPMEDDTRAEIESLVDNLIAAATVETRQEHERLWHRNGG